jgi:orotate phosphoribosyltransferase
MDPHKKAFLDLAVERQALRFGRFTLKSGRISPYFFNAGRFDSGAALLALGRAYRAAAEAAGLGFDMLFGPAYKGIPLATALALAYAEDACRDLPVCFNRKEAKDHGEGGSLIGAPLAGRVLVVDDVITAGTAIREALAIIAGAGAEAGGILVALDRQERGEGGRSAVQEIEQRFRIPVVAVATLDDLLDYADRSPDLVQQRASLIRYRDAHGCRSGA